MTKKTRTSTSKKSKAYKYKAEGFTKQGKLIFPSYLVPTWLDIDTDNLENYVCWHTNNPKRLFASIEEAKEKAREPNTWYPCAKCCFWHLTTYPTFAESFICEDCGLPWYRFDNSLQKRCATCNKKVYTVRCVNCDVRLKLKAAKYAKFIELHKGYCLCCLKGGLK